MDTGRPWSPSTQELLLLDGATATNLYPKGLPHGVCVEEWILQHPAAIQELQQEFVQAGSDILYAPTFGANRPRLSRYGHGGEVRDYNLRLVELTRESVSRVSSGRTVRVAGDLSPTGLQLAPAGETTFLELIAAYEEQAAVLNEAGVDLFVIETMMSIPECRAAVLACRKFGKPIFVTVTLTERGTLLYGGSFATALVALQGLGISAFGLNCSTGPDAVPDLIRDARSLASIPLISKPNAGKPNPVRPSQYDLSPSVLPDMMRAILDAGATIIGGCCGTTPAHIAGLRALLDSYTPLPDAASEETPDLVLATDRELFRLEHERIEFTEPLVPELDMADALLDAEDTGADVIRLAVETPEEADEFAENAHFARLPICFCSNSEEALERALLLYHGRCMIDRSCAIPEKTLADLAARYGAVLY